MNVSEYTCPKNMYTFNETFAVTVRSMLKLAL